MSLHKQIVIIFILVTNGECIQINQDINSNIHVNSTTLYPVEKKGGNYYNLENKDNKIKSDFLNREITNWNINATYAALPYDDYDDDEDIEKTVITHTINNGTNTRDTKKDNQPNVIIFPKDETAEEDREKGKTFKTNPNAASKDKEKDCSTDQRTKDKKFKPSPHLNSYLDTLDDTPLRYLASIAQREKSRPSSFYESPQTQYKHSNNFPKDFVAFPYKYVNTGIIPGKVWRNIQGLQSNPTVEAPVRIPAGGLYRHPDVLKEKPNSYGDDEHFSLDLRETHNLKDVSQKKRTDWKQLLHLVKAMLPVSLIVSALTPNIIALQNTGPRPQNFKRLSRRTDGEYRIPAVSDNCKRRLLCEIRSERNYQNIPSPYRGPQYCYKFRCEDPKAVSRVLRWLLTYQKSRDDVLTDFT